MGLRQGTSFRDQRDELNQETSKDTRAGASEFEEDFWSAEIGSAARPKFDGEIFECLVASTTSGVVAEEAEETWKVHRRMVRTCLLEALRVLLVLRRVACWRGGATSPSLPSPSLEETQLSKRSRSQ